MCCNRRVIPLATCFDRVLQAGWEACHSSCAARDCVRGGCMQSLVVVFGFVLFCVPIRRVRRGGCTSAMLGGSVAIDCVMFSMAGTLGTVLLCTLRATWLCCSVGYLCVCTLRSDALDFRCACVQYINCQMSLSVHVQLLWLLRPLVLGCNEIAPS